MSDDRLDQLSYYELFQIDEKAGVDQIKVAFHAFARRFHPDRFAGETDERRARASQIYRRGAEAYRVLCDPPERHRYDQGLAAGRLRLEEAPPQRSSRTSAPGLVKNPKARPLAQKAKELLAAGDLKGAKNHAKLALGHDTEDPTVIALLETIEKRLAGG